jgi:hypothetical protein
MRRWLLVAPLTLLPLTANADPLDGFGRPLANDRLMATPQAIAPRVLTPLIAPTATPPMGLYSPIGDTTEKMQVLPPMAPPKTVPPTIQVDRPVPPVPPQTVPTGGGGNNSCATAFNAVCDEPSLCAAGTDNHDCQSGGNQ